MEGVVDPIWNERGVACRAALRVLACVALIGCAQPGAEEGGGDALSLSVPVTGAVMAPAEAVVLWEVSSGSRDYAFAWGRAAVSAGRFELSLDEPPPAEAMNAYGLGVGVVATTLRPAALPEGKLPDAFDERQLTGLSDRHAIIYADHDAANAYIEANKAGASMEELQRARQHWLFDFPDGYSCGLGIPAPPGEVFDSFVPQRCDNFEVHQGDVSTFVVTNWI
jgi:hypothetical protein